ncbi:DNA alkylation repair protein [Aquimarina agarivorans]|uniref:DNA alkylation repair protein n=1 Tax=Aquimarina agarivorans TaxID=980584 RepID=UPI000248E9B8|nr:DNA alkylation repair protein [Aquimarina agarivorans]
MIPEHIINRKGPRSLKELNPEVLVYLNRGEVETKNLMEWLATDQLMLLKTVLDQVYKMDWFVNFESAVNAQKKPTANSTTKIIGEVFFSLAGKNTAIYSVLQNHTSDLARCWACWAQSLQYESVERLLPEMKMYAADSHFGVREVVIFATKPSMIENLETSIVLLKDWTDSTDENIRRFAVEALRPVGVWTKKIVRFQENPELGLKILAPLKSDASKYVRDAVGNWLNDASKTSPDWVQSLCKKMGERVAN